MDTPKGTVDFGSGVDPMLEELAEYKPEPLTLERVTELKEHESSVKDMAMEGQFGFQILMMHPTGHVQMMHDLYNLVDFWLEHNAETLASER